MLLFQLLIILLKVTTKNEMLMYIFFYSIYRCKKRGDQEQDSSDWKNGQSFLSSQVCLTHRLCGMECRVCSAQWTHMIRWWSVRFVVVMEIEISFGNCTWQGGKWECAPIERSDTNWESTNGRSIRWKIYLEKW